MAYSTTRSRIVLRLLQACLVFVAARSLKRFLVPPRSGHAPPKAPPPGSFLQVRGLRLCYLDCGRGQPVVLLHGNGGSIVDFLCSGLVAALAKKYRVIVFDRPGYGDSERLPGLPTAARQADLIAEALRLLEADDVIVLGHSWGASIAVALSASHPRLVKGLVLVSGYYFPTLRLDAPAAAIFGLPLIGQVLRPVLGRILGRALWPVLMRRIFNRAPPAAFDASAKPQALRLSTLRASAIESGLLQWTALRSCARYRDLRLPIILLAGDRDAQVDAGQSRRAHEVMARSRLRVVEGGSHMLHYDAPQSIVDAVSEIANAPAEAGAMSTRDVGNREG